MDKKLYHADCSIHFKDGVYDFFCEYDDEKRTKPVTATYKGKSFTDGLNSILQSIEKQTQEPLSLEEQLAELKKENKKLRDQLEEQANKQKTSKPACGPNTKTTKAKKTENSDLNDMFNSILNMSDDEFSACLDKVCEDYLKYLNK